MNLPNWIASLRPSPASQPKRRSHRRALRIDTLQQRRLFAADVIAAEPIVDEPPAIEWVATELKEAGEGFQGGVRVAVGDINGDGITEQTDGPRIGGGPHVRIFDGPSVGDAGTADLITAAGHGGGPHVKVFDAQPVSDEGTADIITAPGPGGGPHVKVFNVLPVSDGGTADLITAAGPGGGPHVRVFNG